MPFSFLLQFESFCCIRPPEQNKLNSKLKEGGERGRGQLTRLRRVGDEVETQMIRGNDRKLHKIKTVWYSSEVIAKYIVEAADGYQTHCGTGFCSPA